MISESKLKFWIENNQNVLFVGKHGVGKTARVLNAFEESKLKWLYFSASTLDPWVDFIGIPKEVKDANGNSYIDLVRPKAFAEDDVEAIFLDEYNRSPKKVRNAVMELIQFKSINGKKFKNLRIIWAAINPDEEGDGEEGYDVEKLDPAQRDRFHVIVDVPYKPDRGYFVSKYGKEISEDAIGWWTDLDKVSQNSVSPRRLDYALDLYVKKGDLRDVLPSNVNVTKLIQELGGRSTKKAIADLYSSQDVDKSKIFLSSRNNVDAITKLLNINEGYRKFFLPLIGEEDLARLMSTSNIIYENVIQDSKYESIIQEIKKTKSSLAKRLMKDVPQKIKGYTFSSVSLDNPPNAKRSKKFTIKTGVAISYVLSSKRSSLYGTYDRVCAINYIIHNIKSTDDIKTFKESIEIMKTLFERSNFTTINKITHIDHIFGFVIKKLSLLNGRDAGKELSIFNASLSAIGKNKLNLFLVSRGIMYV